MARNFAYTLQIWPSLFTLILLVALSIYSGRRRSVPGAIPLMIACLFGAAWAAGSAMEYAAVDLPTKIAWVKFQLICQLPVVIAITGFILEYAWPGRWLTRRVLALLAFAWLIEIGLILTNDLHHWLWRGFRIDGSVQLQFGLGAWLFIAFGIGGLGSLNLVIFGWLFRHSPQQRWPVALMLTGLIGGRLLFLLERASLLHSVLSLALLGMAFEFLLYALALFGFRIFDPIPMARQAAIEQIQYGMLVLDSQDKILSLNPAASAILGSPVRHLLGRSIQDLLPGWADIHKDLQLAAASPIELRFPEMLSLGKTQGTSRDGVGTGTDSRDYQVDVSTLRDWRGVAVGRLLMLRDVTDQKKAQAQILEQKQALARSQERENLARDLHDELSQDLSYINVEAQAVCDLLAAGQVEQARVDLQRLAKIARAAQVDVRGQITRLSLDALSKEGFPGALRQFVKSFWSAYGIQAELCLSQDSYEYSLEPSAEVQLLRIVQEAFTNIRKHASARNVRVALENPAGRVILSIEDDGVGFDPDQNPAGRASFGLRFMSQRAAEMGGSVTVYSNPSTGTRVVVEVPVSSEP